MQEKGPLLTNGVSPLLDIAALKTFRPLIATPCYGGMLCRNFAEGILKLQRVCFDSGIPIEFHLRPGDSLVTRARNDCVAFFLASRRFTHLFFIDADIGFEPDAALRGLRANRDIAAGVYPLKRVNWPAEGTPEGTTRAKFEALYTRYALNTGKAGQNVDLVIEDDGYVKVREAPTGFMCIKRSVFERLIAAYPELKYVADWPQGLFPEGTLHYRFFDTMVDPETGRYLSEDYAFCRLWERIGGEVYVDAKSNLTHQGESIFRGDFAASLQTSLSMAVPAPRGEQMRLRGINNLK